MTTDSAIPDVPPIPPTPPAPAAPPAPPALPAETDVVAVPEGGGDPSLSTVKSTALATLLAFIPFSLGHLYLGLYNRALIMFGAFWFSIFLELPIIAVFFYFFSIIDAFRQAQLINSHGGEDLPDAPEAGKGGLTLGVFMVVVGVVLLLRTWIDFYQIKYFLQEYSPVLLVVAGIYLIFDNLRSRSSGEADDADEY